MSALTFPSAAKASASAISWRVPTNDPRIVMQFATTSNSGTGTSPGGRPTSTQVPRLRVMPMPCLKAMSDGAAGSDQLFAQLEGGRNADRFDGRVDAAPIRQLQDFVQRLAVGAVDDRRGAEAMGHPQAIVIEIDHDGAVGIHEHAAIRALAAGADTADQHMVSRLESGYSLADRVDNVHTPMAQDAAGLTTRQIPLENMQVGAAIRCFTDLGDFVRGHGDFRLRTLFKTFLVGTQICESFHC